jgi:hypothetical protein
MCVWGMDVCVERMDVCVERMDVCVGDGCMDVFGETYMTQYNIA